MNNRSAAAVVFALALGGTLAAQTPKPAAAKTVLHEITITASDDQVYAGTMEMAIDAGKVTGQVRLKTPTEITGTVAGTAKDGVLALEFPFHMTERKCDGTVKMNITLPAAPGAATGTMEAVGCGRDQSDVLTGKVNLKPVTPPAAATPAGRRGGGDDA